MDIESPLERKAEEELRKGRGTESIPFELAMADTPKARSIIFASELENSVVHAWLDGATRSSRNFCANADKYFDSQIEFTKLLAPNACPESRINRPVFDLFLQTWSNMEKLHRRLNIELKNMILGTLHRLDEEEVSKLKEEKKKLDKLADKYAVSLTKYSQMSLKKETTQVEEEAFQLYETRLIYVNGMIDYVAMLKRFGNSFELNTSQKFLEYLESEMSFFKKAYEMYLENLPAMEALKTAILKKKEEVSQMNSLVDSQVIQIKEAAAVAYRPIRSKEVDLEALNHNKTTKEGYLWKKLRSSGAMARWDRRYFSLYNQTLTYRTFSPERGFRGFVITNNIGTCVIKPTAGEKIDRRFCFEIETNTKQQWLLQAENEFEFRDWMVTLENAQQTIQQIPAVVEPIITQVDPKLASPDEADSASRKSFGAAPNETIKYPDSSYEQKNKELHDLMKSIPSTDFVFDSCPCKLLKEVPIHGKLYLTQNRVVFYSAFLKIVTAHVIYVSEITSIETNKKEGVLQKNLEIHTATHKFVFSMRKSRDWDLREAIVKVWMWHKDQKEKTEIPASKVQELYDSLYKNYTREQKDESDSSGSEDEGEEDKGDSSSSNQIETIAPPPDFQPPKEEVNAEVEPYGEVLLNEVFPISVQRMNAAIFEQNDPIHQKFVQVRGYTNVKYEEWTPNAEGKLQRIFDYMTPLNVPMVKEKATEAIENQTYVKKDDFVRYVVEVHTTTPNAPYGDTFETQIRYLLTFVTPKSCRLNISLNVEFKKSTAFKGMVSKGVVKGVRQMVTDLTGVLKKESKPRSSKAGAEGNEAVEVDVKTRSPSGEVKQMSFFGSLPIPGWAPLVLLGLSLLLNLYFVAFYSPASRGDEITFSTDPLRGVLNEELVKIIDVENDSLSWSSIEQKMQEKAYISMRNQLKDLRVDLVDLFHSVSEMEERLFQAQAVNLIMDRVKDCHNKFGLLEKDKDKDRAKAKGSLSLSKEHKSCLRVEFLLKEFLTTELQKEKAAE